MNVNNNDVVNVKINKDVW